METAIIVRIHASYTNSIRKRRVNSLFMKLYGYNPSPITAGTTKS
ncbi:MAG: hypothetical protein QW292_13445 [Candidatus Parvarchaeota archaeon]